MKKNITNLAIALSLTLVAGYSFLGSTEKIEAQAGTSKVNCVKTSSGGEGGGSIGFTQKRNCKASGCAWETVTGDADTCVIKNETSIF